MPSSTATIIQARARRFTSSRFSGNELTLACSPVDTIVVVCGNSRTVGRHGRAITGATLDLDKLEKGWLLKKPSPWLRAVVIDHSGRRAWTNPIWRDEL